MTNKTLIVVDCNGDERDFTNDDNTEYLYSYGEGINGEPANVYDLHITAITEGPQKLVAVFFHPRYLKVIYE